MNTIEQMWQKFEAHQPEADRLGYGEAWRRMCEERTAVAADAAAAAAWAARGAAWAAEAARWAAWAAAHAEAAAWAAAAARAAAKAVAYAAEAWEKREAAADVWTKRAIECIERAGGKAMSQQPEALRLADWIESEAPPTDAATCADVAAELRRLYEMNLELLAALKAAVPHIATKPLGCHGYKCRENWCWSCNSEEDAETAAQAGYDASAKASDAIAKAEGRDET
jgi:hypothetical protein